MRACHFVCCVVATACVSLLLAQDEQKLAEHFHAGQAAAGNQQFDRAITEFRAALQIDPSLVQARANLGLMYYLSGNYSEAVKQLSTVTRTDAGILPAELFLGLSYVKLGAFEQAIAPLEKAKHLDSSNAQAARGLLACDINLGRYREAATELQFFERRSDEEALYITGQAYLDMGRTLTSRMAQNYRSSPWAHRLAADLAAERGDWNTAVDEYQKAIAADAAMPGVQHSLEAAKAHEKETDPVGPGEVVQGGNDSPEGLYEQIRVYTTHGEEYFKKLQDSFPDSAYAHELRGDVYRVSQDFPSALREFKAALVKFNEDAALHRSAAEMDILLGRLDDAEAELQQAAKLNAGNAETEYLLGQVYSKSDRTEQAVEHLKEAVRRDPNLLQARALLGTAYMHLKEPALAAPELEKALPLDYYGDLHFQLYRAYAALGKTEAAEKALAASKEIRAKSFRSTVAKISGAESR